MVHWLFRWRPSKELEIFLIFPTLLLFSCQSHTSWPRVCAKHVIPNCQVACLHNLQSLWQKWRTGSYKLRAGQNWVFDWQVDLSGSQSEMIVPIAKCSFIVFLHEQWPKSWLLNVSRESYHPVLWQTGDIRSHYEGSLLTNQYHVTRLLRLFGTTDFKHQRAASTFLILRFNQGIREFICNSFFPPLTTTRTTSYQPCTC